ncbi:MAG TPA: clostripain-related cysteine peptidase [Methylomirabilota bacterium]|nr:clostripain-related cysteine peptidase [Methylomirabilota bacterium]
MTRPAEKTKRWTVMVYLAGDNNLDSAGADDLLEVKTVGSSDQVTVVAQFDRSGAGRATNRYLLRKNTPLTADVVTALGETDTGDPAVLRDFVTWAVTSHPAQHYLLVIWNHGSGWDDSNLYQGDYFSGAAPPVVRKGKVVARALVADSPGPIRMDTVRAAARRARRSLFRSTVARMVSSRAIAFDDQAKDFLDNIELKRVLGQIRRTLKRKIDVLGFDACLMSMVEVAYQVRDHVGLTCGSEEEEPNDGWPYDTILKALVARPSMKPADLAKLVVGRYVASYGPRDGATMAATDLAGIGAVADAIHRLGRVLTTALRDDDARAQIWAVRAQVQEYTPPYDQYCDVADLCDLLARRVRRPAVATACRAVRAALSRAVLASAAKGQGLAHSHGLTVYFPKKTVSRLYATLDFARKGGWAAFIDAYTRSIGRRPR